MPDNVFNAGMNQANDAFAILNHETFSVVKVGNIGDYEAVSIDDLTMATAVAAGGLRGDNTVGVFVNRDVFLTTAIKEGSVLSVRGKHVRVSSIADQGDNTLMLQCIGAGVRL